MYAYLLPPPLAILVCDPEWIRYPIRSVETKVVTAVTNKPLVINQSMIAADLLDGFNLTCKITMTAAR